MPPRKKAPADGEVVKPKTTRKKKEPVSVEGDSLASLLGMDEHVPYVMEEYKTSKLSPFDFINQITFGKTNIILDDEQEKQYSPYMVNRGLSNSMDCIMWANEMNSRPHIPNSAQNLFLLNVIPKRKRYDKWAKEEDVENLELIMEFYEVSRMKGLQILSLLSADNIEYIKKKTFKGGLR